MVAILRTTPATRRLGVKDPSGLKTKLTTYKNQNLDRTYTGFWRALGYNPTFRLEFASYDDWTKQFESTSNYQSHWAGKGRRMIISIPFATKATSNWGGSRYPSATGGNGNFASLNAGMFDEIWNNWALTCSKQDLDDAIFRLAWEMEGTYFQWTASGLSQATEWRRSWRRIWSIIKSGTHKAHTVKATTFFNPTGFDDGNAGTNFWPGVQTIGGSAPPLATWGLPGDYFRDSTAGLTYYKPYDGTPNSTWVQRPDLGWPIVLDQPDDLAIKDDGTPFLDGNGNPYHWVNIVGPECYAQLFNSNTALSIEDMWFKNSYGTGLGVEKQTNVNSRGLLYWAEFAVFHKKVVGLGEGMSGYKVDFPGDVGSIEVFGHGGPGDNAFHVRKICEHCDAFNALFWCNWDQPAGDFMCEWSNSEIITGIPLVGDFRGDKPAVASVMIEHFGAPGRPLRPFDASNLAPTSVNIAWRPGLVTVLGPNSVQLNSVCHSTRDIIDVADLTASPAGAKRLVYATFFGGTGEGYGILCIGGRNLTNSPDRRDPVQYDKLKLRLPLRTGEQKSFYVMTMNEVGFLRSPLQTVVANNQAGTFGRTDGGTNLDCAADQLNLVAITTPSPASTLVIPMSLQIKLGTGAAAGQKFRAVIYAKPTATTRGGSPLLISADTTLTSSDVAAGFKTIIWEPPIAVALVPGTEYWFGVWGNSTCDLAISTTGSSNTFRGTSIYSTSNTPGGSTTLADTGSLGIYASVGYEF